MKKSAYLERTGSRYIFGISAYLVRNFDYVELEELTSLKENKSLANALFVKHEKTLCNVCGIIPQLQG